MPNNHIYMCSRTPSRGQAALAELQSLNLPSPVALTTLDVTAPDTISASAAQIQREQDRLDILINNAGVSSLDPDTRSNLREHFETNTIGPALVTEAFMPLLEKAKDPYLIYVSSVMGSITLKCDQNSPLRDIAYTHYRMSKSALDMLVACQQCDYGPKGFKVFAYCPGYVISDLAGEGTREDRKRKGGMTADESAKGLVGIVSGERDAEMGGIVHRGGVYPW